jgi:hypothetical protein
MYLLNTRVLFWSSSSYEVEGKPTLIASWFRKIKNMDMETCTPYIDQNQHKSLVLPPRGNSRDWLGTIHLSVSGIYTPSLSFIPAFANANSIPS